MPPDEVPVDAGLGSLFGAGADVLQPTEPAIIAKARTLWARSFERETRFAGSFRDNGRDHKRSSDMYVRRESTVAMRESSIPGAAMPVSHEGVAQ